MLLLKFYLRTTFERYPKGNWNKLLVFTCKGASRVFVYITRAQLSGPRLSPSAMVVEPLWWESRFRKEGKVLCNSCCKRGISMCERNNSAIISEKKGPKKSKFIIKQLQITKLCKIHAKPLNFKRQGNM